MVTNRTFSGNSVGQGRGGKTTDAWPMSAIGAIASISEKAINDQPKAACPRCEFGKLVHVKVAYRCVARHLIRSFLSATDERHHYVSLRLTAALRAVSRGAHRSGIHQRGTTDPQDQERRGPGSKPEARTGLARLARGSYRDHRKVAPKRGRLRRPRAALPRLGLQQLAVACETARKQRESTLRSSFDGASLR
jgi:hypothetical protein